MGVIASTAPHMVSGTGGAQETVAGIAGIATAAEQSRNTETNAVDSLAQGNAGRLEGRTWGRGSERAVQCRG